MPSTASTNRREQKIGLKILWAALIAATALALAIWGSASAHQEITVGKYKVEIGWVNEPPVVGQRNAVIMNVSSEDGSVKPEDIDTQGLKVEVVYGSESKALEIQPLGEDTPGQFIAPILPTRAGKYTLKLGGTLGGDPASAEVQPEEVAPADTLEFPAMKDQASGPDLNAVMPIAGVILGSAGLIAGLAALLRKK